MAKVTIYEVTIKPKEVELPEKCPKCGKRVNPKDMNVIEENVLTETCVEGAFIDGEFEGDGYTDWDGAQYYAVGYGCPECKHFLVGGKATVEE